MSRIIREDILFYTTPAGNAASVHKEYIIGVVEFGSGCQIQVIGSDEAITVKDHYLDVMDKWLSAPEEHNNLLPITKVEPDTARPV